VVWFANVGGCRPLPSSVSGYKGASDEFIDANIQLALTLARKLYETKGITSCLVFPDKPERRRASRIFRTALELSSGVSVGCLDDAPSGGAVKSFWGSVRGALDFDFGEDVEGWFTFLHHLHAISMCRTHTNYCLIAVPAHRH
jgi:hypothetical protein